MKAGPQNRRFASVTCSKVSSATVWVKYPQQTIIIEMKNVPLKCNVEKNSKFGHTSFIKVVT